MSEEKELLIGTRIQFIKTLTGDADETGPSRLYARKGEFGTITGHGTPEGYWVKTDRWPTSFGASVGIEFIAIEAAVKAAEGDQSCR